MPDMIQPTGTAAALQGPLNKAARPADSADAGLERAARAFETAFLAEMLKHSGLGKTPEAFGGGEGEAQFASMLQEAQARKLVEAGGIGLAEYLVAAMKEDQE